MDRIITARLSVAIAIILLSSTGFAIEPSNSGTSKSVAALESFRRDYMQALSKLEGQYANVSCEIKYAEPSFDADISFYVKDHALQSIRRVTRSQAGLRMPLFTVKSVSPAQAFELTKSSESQPYVIRALGEDARKGLDRYHKLNSGKVVFAPFYVFYVPMRTVMESPSSRIESVSKGPEDNQQIVRVKFKTDPKDCVFNALNVAFLPDSDWIISEFEANYSRMLPKGEDKAIYRGKIAYSKIPPDSIFFPSHIEIIGDMTPVPPAQPWTFKNVADIKKVSFAPVNDEQFQLKHFRLPEMDLVRSSVQSSLWQWIVGANLFGLGIILFVYARRRRRA